MKGAEHPDQAARHRRRAAEHQSANARAPAHPLDRDMAAERPPEDGKPLQVERVGDLFEAVGKAGHGVGPARGTRIVRIAMPWQVDCDQSPAFRKLAAELPLEHTSGKAGAMDKNDRESGSAGVAVAHDPMTGRDRVTVECHRSFPMRLVRFPAYRLAEGTQPS